MRYPKVPRFPAEHFGRVAPARHALQAVRRRRLQLEEEGLIQVVFPVHGRREPILGVVGPLQLDVVEARLQAGIQRRLQDRFDQLRGPALGELRPEAALGPREPLHRHPRAVDRDERPVLLFESQWGLNYITQQNPEIEFATFG